MSDTARTRFHGASARSSPSAVAEPILVADKVSKSFPGVLAHAYKMVLEAFTRNPDIKGVFSHNDEMVRGVVSALRQIGKLAPAGEAGHVVIVGLDGMPLAHDRIRAKDGSQDASVGQDPNAMGGAILDAIIAHFDGKPINESAQTKPVLITAQNVDDPTLWGNFGKQ